MIGANKWAARALALAALTTTMALASTGLAFADNITDTIEATAPVSIKAGESSTTAQVKVVSSNGNDGDADCNIDGTETFVLSFTGPAGVTAADLSIPSCDTFYPVNISTTAAAVSGTITAIIKTNTTGAGTFNNNVNIPVTITQPPAPTNTAPVVSVTGVANGATYERSSVPQPECSVVDAEDTNESATPQISNGPYDALGSHAVTCSYTDGGSIIRSATATYTVVRDRDTTAPVITETVTGTMGSNGWYTGNVSLDWTVTENESPETLVLTGCDDVTVSADQAAADYSCSAVSEGGTAAEQTVSIQRDGTAPVITNTATASGTTGLNGWYISDVTVRFSAADNLSGFTGGLTNPHTFTRTTSGEGSAVTVDSSTVNDVAGNTSNSVTSSAFKIDLNNPTVTCGTAPTFVLGSTGLVPATVADGVSGPREGVTSLTVDATTSSVGAKTVAVTGHDNAGRSTTVDCSYNVVFNWNGFFQPIDNVADQSSGATPAATAPGWNKAKAGSSIPVKFSLAGNQGLNIFEAGYPKVTKITCPSGTLVADAVEETVTTTSGLKYDALADQYNYTWKTATTFAGTCQRLEVKLVDGTSHYAFFNFIK
jgi:hypothetical protein